MKQPEIKRFHEFTANRVKDARHKKWGAIKVVMKNDEVYSLDLEARLFFFSFLSVLCS